MKYIFYCFLKTDYIYAPRLVSVVSRLDFEGYNVHEMNQVVKFYNLSDVPYKMPRQEAFAII